jgi:uncharacterized surface protein with fasciclin (FAS1) repeats
MSNKRLAAAVAAGTLALSAVGVANAKNPLNPVPGKPGAANIVQIAQFVNANSGEFSYLLAAATCGFFDGAVVELLSGEDKYTLFAPTDAAFMAVLGQDPQEPENPAAICNAYSGEEGSVGAPGDLFAILAYHVTDGRRFSNSVFNRKATKMVEMLAGGYIVTNPNLTINDNAGQTVNVVPTLELTNGTEIGAINVNASNGVIHTIDTVLLP